MLLLHLDIGVFLNVALKEWYSNGIYWVQLLPFLFIIKELSSVIQFSNAIFTWLSGLTDIKVVFINQRIGSFYTLENYQSRTNELVL